jgi:hypothetical protein
MVHTFEKKNYLFFNFLGGLLLSLVWRPELVRLLISLSRKKMKKFAENQPKRGVSAYAIPFARGPLTIFAFE